MSQKKILSDDSSYTTWSDAEFTLQMARIINPLNVRLLPRPAPIYVSCSHSAAIRAGGTFPCTPCLLCGGLYRNFYSRLMTELFKSIKPFFAQFCSAVVELGVTSVALWLDFGPRCPGFQPRWCQLDFFPYREEINRHC